MRFITTTAYLIIIVAGLQIGKALLVPLVFAFFLAILLFPIVRFLQKHRFPDPLAVFIPALFTVGIFIAFGILISQVAGDFNTRVPYYMSRLDSLMKPAKEWLAMHHLEKSWSEMFNDLQPASIIDFFAKSLRGLISALSSLFMVLILMIFMLLEGAEFNLKIQVAGLDFNRMSRLVPGVQKYLVIRSGMSVLTGILIGFFTYFMGLDFPILWALVAFVLNYIPIIGSIIASIPAILLALIQLGFGGALGITAGYLFFNITISNFLEPVLMGRQLRLSPLVILVSLGFWGWIWGPSGALLSIPLTMIIKIMLENSYNFHWVSVLMDSKPRVHQVPTQSGDN